MLSSAMLWITKVKGRLQSQLSPYSISNGKLDGFRHARQNSCHWNRGASDGDEVSGEASLPRIGLLACGASMKLA